MMCVIGWGGDNMAVVTGMVGTDQYMCLVSRNHGIVPEL